MTKNKGLHSGPTVLLSFYYLSFSGTYPFHFKAQVWCLVLGFLNK